MSAGSGSGHDGPDEVSSSFNPSGVAIVFAPPSESSGEPKAQTAADGDTGKTKPEPRSLTPDR